MGFRISNIHEYDQFVAIDLGSHRIRALLYSFDDGRLELQGHASIRQSQKNIHNGNIMDMQGVAHTLERAIHEACRDVPDIPKDIIISYSPVVSIGDVMTSQYIRSDPETGLSMDELDTMIEKIERASLARAKERAKSEYAIIHDDIRLISSTLTSIVIDGKQVSNPFGSPGQHIRITVLNIYTLASEYNIMRSIVSSLNKNTISIVPTALLLPKSIEKSRYTQGSNLYIDIGHTHMTLVSDEKNEIQYFETFSTGSKMFLDIMSGKYPRLSYTEIESLVMRSHVTPEERAERESLAREYFSYVIDAIISVIDREGDSIATKNLFISGGLFTSKWLESLFFEMLEESFGSLDNRMHLANAAGSTGLPSEYLLTTALASLGQELLYVKKDPIIRILRYTLYHYE